MIRCAGTTSGRNSYVFAGVIGEFVTLYCRTSNARPYILIYWIFKTTFQQTENEKTFPVGFVLFEVIAYFQQPHQGFVGLLIGKEGCIAFVNYQCFQT